MDMTEIIIVSIGCFALFVAMPTVVSISSYKEKKLKLEAKGLDTAMRDEFEAMKTEVTQLRNRVAVLERLATDDDRKLAQEITRLQRNDINPRA